MEYERTMLVKCIAILMFDICFLYRKMHSCDIIVWQREHKMHGRPRGLRKL